MTKIKPGPESSKEPEMGVFQVLRNTPEGLEVAVIAGDDTMMIMSLNEEVLQKLADARINLPYDNVTLQ